MDQFWCTKICFNKKLNFKKYIHKKDRHIKEELHKKYKNYRNIIPARIKKSKQNYFTKYFESNIKNLKNTWKGIKSISLKKFSVSLTHSFEFQ